MGNGTAETEWPSSTTVSEEKKAFLDNYFGLLDTNEAAAIDRLAELFTEDGCMITPAGKVEGPERTFQSQTCPCPCPCRMLNSVLSLFFRLF